jgi:hypothetical protein
MPLSCGLAIGGCADFVVLGFNAGILEVAEIVPRVEWRVAPTLQLTPDVSGNLRSNAWIDE